MSQHAVSEDAERIELGRIAARAIDPCNEFRPASPTMIAVAASLNLAEHDPNGAQTEPPKFKIRKTDQKYPWQLTGGALIKPKVFPTWQDAIDGVRRAMESSR